MPYEPVTVTQFRAKDGSLHGSRDDAERHDKWMQREALLDAVREIIQQETWRGDFSDFCGYGQEDGWTRKSRNEEIARIVIDKWADLSAVLAKAEGW